MRDFKVGDTVIGTKHVKSYRDQAWITVGKLYEVIKVTVCYVYVVRDDGYADGFPKRDLPFEIHLADELPPVPDSTLYINKVNWGIKLYVAGNDLLISTGNPNNFNSGWAGATMCPDTALQLAHDLTRMAMELKRKQEK